MSDGVLETDIFYEYKTEGNLGKTIVFIHGITGSSSAWNPYFDFFHKKGFDVLKFDLRGHGLSLKKNSTDYYKIENIASDMISLLKKNHIKDPIFVSHSFGTFVLLDFIRKYKKFSISKIVFISPTYKLNFNFLSKIFIKLGTFLPVFRNRGIQIDYSKYFKNTNDFTFKRIFIESLNTGLKIVSSLFHFASSCDNYFDVFSDINSPVLLIHGRKDKVSSFRNSISINSKIENSHLKIYDDFNHIIVLNNYNEIIDDLYKFIIS